MNLTQQNEIKLQLAVEQLAIFAASLYIFSLTGAAWYIFPLLLLVPDVSMVGYLRNPKWGARLYNLAHNQALALGVIAFGIIMADIPAVMIGTVLLGHSSLDRVFGFGLKFNDDFKHTHLD